MLEDTAPIPASTFWFVHAFVHFNEHGRKETEGNLENLLLHINNIFNNLEKRGNCSLKLGTQYSFESIFILIFFIKKQGASTVLRVQLLPR